ncbi:hypothetical protein GYA19_02970 [Candidatus Beckwithbacteria bacterium]|nr:hypothetical protein [Candidatus Beckwithbacteria bacterium]
MIQKILFILGGFLTGLFLSYWLVFHPSLQFNFSGDNKKTIQIEIPQKQIIGFLPYWLIDKAKADYSEYITTLTYFGLTINKDGTIMKKTNPQETEPGWNDLQKGKLDSIFKTAKEKKLKLSLLVFSGNHDSINELISKPEEHAHNLTQEVIPIMQQYGFTDLNLDIESIKQASESARLNFTQFAQVIKQDLDKAQIGSLTIDITGSDLIKQNLINPQSIVSIADYVVLMGYDYHYMGSFVTGAVAPLAGAETSLEYDVQTAVGKMEQIMPVSKIILGLPLYGYEWETINENPNSAVIPSSGLTASNQRIEDFLSKCSSCSAQRNFLTQESSLIYKDQQTGTYHQMFYPDEISTTAKVNFAKEQDLGGLALWALGYEGRTILEPLKDYK